LINKGREYFVSLEDTRRTLESCPDRAWQAIVGLCRRGGFRCPSQVSGLMLDDIDWARGRMRVHSGKTEWHEGHEGRWVPLFPERVPVARDHYLQVLDSHFERAANSPTEAAQKAAQLGCRGARE
jgi:integrase